MNLGIILGKMTFTLSIILYEFVDLIQIQVGHIYFQGRQISTYVNVVPSF